MTKKFFSLLLILASVFSMTSCITDEPDEPDSDVVVPAALIGTWKVVESKTINSGNYAADPDPLIDETITVTSSKITHSRKLANGKTEVTDYKPKNASEQTYGVSLTGFNEKKLSTASITKILSTVKANITFPANPTKSRELTLQRVN